MALLGKFGSGRLTLANQIARRLRTNNPKLKIEVFNAFRVIPTDLETMLSTIVIVPDLIKSWYTDKHTDNIIQILQKLRSDAEENNCFIIATFQYDTWDIINRQSNRQNVHKNIISLFPKSIPITTTIERLHEIAWNGKKDISNKVLTKICEEDVSIGRPLTMTLIMNIQAFMCDKYFFIQYHSK